MGPGPHTCMLIGQGHSPHSGSALGAHLAPTAVAPWCPSDTVHSTVPALKGGICVCDPAPTGGAAHVLLPIHPLPLHVVTGAGGVAFFRPPLGVK